MADFGEILLELCEKKGETGKGKTSNHHPNIKLHPILNLDFHHPVTSPSSSHSTKNKLKNDLIETFSQMLNNRITWDEIFNKFGLITRLAKFIKETNEQHVYHRIKILFSIAAELNGS